MKYLCLLVPALFTGILTYSQKKEEKQIFEPEVLKKAEAAKKLEPTEKICFDQRFHFISKSGGRSYEGCFWVDTRGGITASKTFDLNGRDPNCSFDIRQKRFHLLVHGMKGNEYIYYNRMEKVRATGQEELRHYVQTGNTHRNPLERVLENKILFKKMNAQEFIDNKYKALEYTTADGKSTLYLWGKNYPDEMNAYAYLGAFGLGYLKTNKGDFIIFKYVHGATEFSLTNMEDFSSSNACFDPTVFKVFEDTKINNLIAESEQSNQRLEREVARQQDRAANTNSPCAALKLEVLEYKKQEAEKKERLLKQMKNQNKPYSDPATVNALAKEYSFIEGIKMERRQLEYDLCVLKTDVEKGRYKPGSESYAKAVQKIACWERKIAEYKTFEEDIKAIDERNRNDVPKASKEKGEYYRDKILPKMATLQCR
jgi:hypothetical protein